MKAPNPLRWSFPNPSSAFHRTKNRRHLQSAFRGVWVNLTRCQLFHGATLHGILIDGSTNGAIQIGLKVGLEPCRTRSYELLRNYIGRAEIEMVISSRRPRVLKFVGIILLVAMCATSCTSMHSVRAVNAPTATVVGTASRCRA